MRCIRPARERRVSPLVRSALTAALVLVALPSGSAAAETLSAAQADCARSRIEALAARTLVEGERGGEPGVPVTVLYAPGRGADLNGTAFTNQWGRHGTPFSHLTGPEPLREAHLPFTVTVLRETLINPARPPLFQVGFLREASSSSLVDPGDPRAFNLVVNPTLQPTAEVDPDDPETAPVLEINALAPHAASAVSSDSKPGRGLRVDRITEPCTDGYGEEDLDFMGSVAQRVLRPIAWTGDGNAPRAYDVLGGIVREPEPGAYRVLLRAVDPADRRTVGRFAARIEAPRTSDGGLGVGTVEVLPEQSEGAAHWELLVVPPTFPPSGDPKQATWSADDPGAARVGWNPAAGDGSGADPATDDVNWYLLLRDSEWNRLSFLKGLALSPEGFPFDFSELPEFYAEAATFPSPAVMWNGSWRAGIDAEGWDGAGPAPFPGGAELTALEAEQKRFTPLFVFGWRSGETPHLAVPGNPVNDWSNAQARQLYADLTARFAEEHRPPFLFLGNESDAYFAAAPEDYPRWIEAYEEAYAAIKQVSPETLVGPVFQLEELAGLGGLSGATAPRWGALEAHDLSTVDVVGISLYPWFRSERAADVPLDHLAPLFERIGDTPVLITETGWPAEEHPEHPVPWKTSEAAQVAYVHRLFRMIQGRDVRGAVWAFLHPLLDDSGLVGRLFGSISLRDEQGAERPVYDVWAEK